MQIQELSNTCSCRHLHGVSHSDLLYPAIGDTDLLNAYKNKAIIYYTTFSWWSDFHCRWAIFKLGFRQIGSYRGYSNGRVYIMLKKPKK